ncbi:response regulator [Variovorax sp. J2P1-59]|uniref:response regulator n=1 Tax=Variovorax flavidus TaxID=3053501 RepID=UPI0025791CFF|nr:response regulator [Variovorax sp. J2P1-59]MDM0077425.1 response regulator [Variovorax sp. J2P1-59]
MAFTAKEATDERTGRARGLRILVVEDDPDALAATVEMLQLLGHWAAGVRSAETAKDRYLDGAFDVLLTDIGLPALSGMDLVESLRARHKLEVIFATGRPPPPRPIEGTFWLQKPFTVEQLETALAQAMNRAEA